MRLEVLDMTLTKIKIGNLITDFNIKNTDNIDYPFYGINIDKEFMPSAASTDSVDRSKYKIVKKGVFVFSGMQTGRDCCIRIAMYEKDDIVLVSPAYTTFTVTSPAILPEYLFMYFRSNEKDRYGAFLSDGSIRSNLDWDVFCDIEIELPSIEIQLKYVETYKSIVENQASYETGLEDLKLVCDAYIEELRRKYPCEKIGKFIIETSRKTDDSKLKIQGISNQHKFNDSNSRINGVDTSKYLRIDSREFGYSPIHINDGSIAFNSSEESFLLSPIYATFKIKNEKEIISEYLMLWFSRSEFTRYCWFYAFGSARDTFEWKQMSEFEVPVPNIEIQHDIVDIYKVYCQRKQINEELKKQIKNICPVLIKGAVEEAKRS